MTDSQRADIIIRNASMLPLEQRKEIARRILERPDALPRSDAEEKMDLLLPIAEKVVGQKMGYTKSLEDVKIRSFVSYYMWKAGQPVTQIAELLGMHHSTVIKYTRKVRCFFDLPVFYAKEVEEYLRFKELAEEKEKEVMDGKER